MSEDQDQKLKRCGKFTLKLTGKSKTYFKGTLIVDFKPLQKTKKIQKSHIIPSFNNDRKYFTPAFIIPSLELEKDEVLISEHERRSKENATEISDILVPKPRNRQKYCGVCRGHYEEYIDHIGQERHRQKLQGSAFQNYILQTCRKFKYQNMQSQSQFQKHNNGQFSAETIFPSTQQDLVDAYLNLQ